MLAKCWQIRLFKLMVAIGIKKSASEEADLMLFLTKLLGHTFLNGNRNCNRCADHRVVAHTD